MKLIVPTKKCLQCGGSFSKKDNMSASYWEKRKLCYESGCFSLWMKGKHNSPETEIPLGGMGLSRTCHECNADFVAGTWNAKYCSDKCYKTVKNRVVKLNPNYSFNNHKSSIRQNFGLSIAQYEDMMTEQQNRCAICRIHQSEEKRRFAVDHNHDTGQIRGLLCINCNRGLGAFKDSDEMLVEATEYLRKRQVITEVSNDQHTASN